MRVLLISVFFSGALFFSGRLVAADPGKPAAGAPHFELPAIGDKPAAPVFTPAQLAFVQSWIRQKVPECPVEAGAAVAQDFLEELQQTQPDKLDRLLAPDFPARQFESMLFRSAAVKLSGPAQLALREKIAVRRVAALQVLEGQSATDAREMVAKLHDTSDFQYRRLLDGRIEDDELQLLLRKPASVPATPLAAGPLQQKALTAAEIVAEYSRHNQVGSAMQRLQAYAADCRLTTANGQVQQLMLYKMRPDRFRLVLLKEGISQYQLGADEDVFWQQTTGQRPQAAAGKDMGERRYLAEFTDPLFAREGYTFALLPEGGAGEGKYYRIGVTRSDGSSYIAWIEPGTFRQIGREEANQSVTRYSNFREIAGVTFAFREEVTDAAGHKAVLEVNRLTANPGLIRDFFHPLPATAMEYIPLEQFAAPGPVAFSK